VTARRIVPGSSRLPTASGAIIMAGGIFGAVALQRLPLGEALTAPLAALLALGWFVIAWLILTDTARLGIAAHSGSLVGSFAIGTWVAASAVVARMAMLAAPDAPWLARAMFIAGSLVWLWFMPRALRNLAQIARSAATETRPTGIVLLTTVATQAVALPAFRLFPEVTIVHGAAAVAMGFGAACYVVGAVLIIRRYVAGSRWQLVTDWDNTNCVLHGALSITGLTAVISGLFGMRELAPFWAATLMVFVVVEAIEVARLVVRVRALGWWQGVFVYDVSQWARNFTFGMFYAFTAALEGHFALSSRYPAIDVLADAILAFGQYIVLALLLAELVLMGWCYVGARTGVRTAV
jgi:hypothetical protein